MRINTNTGSVSWERKEALRGMILTPGKEPGVELKGLCAVNIVRNLILLFIFFFKTILNDGHFLITFVFLQSLILFYCQK